jgi:fructose-specific phosphotransferase system component IIB
MKKPDIDATCIDSLEAAAAALTNAGASTADIVAAFVDVAINLAERDRNYAAVQLEIVANLFSAGEAMARLRMKSRMARKKTRKKA